MLETLTALLALSAIFSFLNERYFKKPLAIGLMAQALFLSVFLNAVIYFYPTFLHSHFMTNIVKIDFSRFVLQGVLCFLLFAGAKNISLMTLRKYKWDVLSLALFSTVLAAFFIGSLIYVILQWIGLKIDYLHALLFGAIIAPTDPIAALAILKSVGLPQSLEVIIDGESQFNDGVGVVIFVTLLTVLSGESHGGFGHIATMFIKSVIGGIGLGLLLGFVMHHLIMNAVTTITQVLITLSMVTITYTLAEVIGISGPIASVVLGIYFGNITLVREKIQQVRQHVDLFWELISQVLNAILFVLIGLIALRVNINDLFIFTSMLLAILIVLVGRFISVYFSMLLLKLDHRFQFTSIKKVSMLLTWSGLKGALAIALVLALPDEPFKNVLIPMVYGVVVFSILVQGSSIKKLYPKSRLNGLLMKQNERACS